MIVNEFVEIKVHTRILFKLIEIGYDVKIGDIVTIKVSELSKSSGQKILVRCDVCGKEKLLSYSDYNRNIKRHNIYSCSSKCGIVKREKTKIKKFGKKYYSQTPEYDKRKKKTCLEKYGVENVFQSEVIKEKIKQTCLDKYGVEFAFQSEIVKDKSKQTNKIKYGDECASKSDEVKNMIKQTCLDKYGVGCSFQSEEVKDKIKATNLIRYGVEYSSQNKKTRDKYKETCLEKYGVDNVSKSDEIKNKKEETSLARYGVKHVSQDPKIYAKQQKSGYRLFQHENTKLYYRGSYEKHFLDYCFENNLPVKQGKRIKYTYENELHYYFSDYYFSEKNLIVEIKIYLNFKFFGLI